MCAYGTLAKDANGSLLRSSAGHLVRSMPTIISVSWSGSVRRSSGGSLYDIYAAPILGSPISVTFGTVNLSPFGNNGLRGWEAIGDLVSFGGFNVRPSVHVFEGSTHVLRFMTKGSFTPFIVAERTGSIYGAWVISQRYSVYSSTVNDIDSIVTSES